MATQELRYQPDHAVPPGDNLRHKYDGHSSLRAEPNKFAARVTRIIPRQPADFLERGAEAPCRVSVKGARASGAARWLTPSKALVQLRIVVGRLQKEGIWGWIDLFGYLAPSVVSDTIGEYRACREAVALMDFSMLRKVDVEGPGAVGFVDSVVTRDLSRLEPGESPTAR